VPRDDKPISKPTPLPRDNVATGSPSSKPPPIPRDNNQKTPAQQKPTPLPRDNTPQVKKPAPLPRDNNKPPVFTPVIAITPTEEPSYNDEPQQEENYDYNTYADNTTYQEPEPQADYYPDPEPQADYYPDQQYEEYEQESAVAPPIPPRQENTSSSSTMFEEELKRKRKDMKNKMKEPKEQEDAFELPHLETKAGTEDDWASAIKQAMNVRRGQLGESNVHNIATHSDEWEDGDANNYF